MVTRDCQAKIAKTTIRLFKSYFVLYAREKNRFGITWGNEINTFFNKPSISRNSWFPKNYQNVVTLWSSRCKWVSFFIGTDLKIFGITSLAHQWMLCSEWVPSESESKQLIKTSYFSICNPHHPSPSINVLWSKKLSVCKKQIHQDIFNLLQLLPWLKYYSSIHNVYFSRETSESGEKYAQIKHCLRVKTVQNSSKEIYCLILMWEHNRA